MIKDLQPCSPSTLTRSRLMDAGQTLFSAQGYAATSMRQVAEKAELALGGIYNHFSSKEALFQAVLFEHNPIKRDNFRPSTENFDWHEVKNLLEELEKQPEFLNLFLIELLEFKGIHLPELLGNLPGEFSPLPSRLSVLSLVISYHVTQTLLVSALPPDQQWQTSLDTFLDDFLTCIKKTGVNT
jgi:AcrR family transcriptional regulator